MLSPKKICIVICYFGEFPWYFSYFLHTCAFNSSIDFLIFSDIPYKGKLPGNVSIIKISFSQVCELISKKLQVDTNIKTPYKLCDFKHSFGLIFSVFLANYDFWGQCDIDIIFGDIRKFMDEAVLNEYDYISARHDYCTGCFSLYRNNDLMNHMFKRGKDYAEVFANPEYLGFDEFNFKHHLLNDTPFLEDIETNIECFTHIIKRAAHKMEIKAHFDFLLLEGLPGKVSFDNGRLFYDKKIEAMLYHLCWLKKVYQPVGIPKTIPNKYFISQRGIYS